METVSSVQLMGSGNQERLPVCLPDFPCLSSCVRLDADHPDAVCWHWHRALELFYLKQGSLEYQTAHQKIVLPEGACGLVNTGVLHRTQVPADSKPVIQLLHLFEPELITPQIPGQLYARYVQPVTDSSGLELLCLLPEDPKCTRIIRRIRESFDLDESIFGYELLRCRQLTDIWLDLLPFVTASCGSMIRSREKVEDLQLKTILVFIQEHLTEPLTVHDLALSAHISERSCYRLFRDCLQSTPLSYIRSLRLRKACRLLVQTPDSITRIAADCGFASASCFASQFRCAFGCTPGTWRKRWQESDTTRHDCDSRKTKKSIS